MGVELRFGRVSSVGAKAHTVRVEFGEVDGVESYDLPVLVTRPGDFALPEGQPQAACLMNEGAEGVGVVIGFIYSEADAPPLDDAGKRAVESDDLRLGAHDATDKVALAPATKAEIQKAIDFTQGVITAIQAGVPTPQDGGAGLKATIVAALPTAPTLSEPAAENVSAK